MYIRGASPFVPPSFPLMAPLVGATLFLDYIEPSTLLPLLLVTLILCNATLVGEGGEEKNHNLIDGHTK